MTDPNNNDDLPDRSIFEAVQRESEAESVALQVLKKESSEIGFMTVARAKSRLRAYEKVADSYNAYIEVQVEQLRQGIFATTPFKELGIARLIAQWIVESEAFFKEAEPLLTATEKKVRRGYLEESFERLPQEIKDVLLREFNKMKQELLIKFVGMVQRATIELETRKAKETIIL